MTTAQYLHVLQVLCSNTSDPTSVINSDLCTENAFSQLKSIDPDPAFTKFAEYHCRLATELLVQLREVVEYARLQERPESNLQSLLIEATAQSSRLLQVTTAVLVTGLLNTYLTEVQEGGSGAATLFNIAQSGQRGSHGLIVIMFQALFELDSHEELVSLYLNVGDEIERLDESTLSQVLNLVYQSALLLDRPVAESIREKLEARNGLHANVERMARSTRVAMTLTDMGRKAYESAVIVLEALGNGKRTWMDAGLASLGFSAYLNSN